MKVAVLYSGGKDSTQAIKWCLDNKYKVVALIAIKPKNTEAYLWHYSTVEWTILQAEAMRLPLILIKSDKIGPNVEAKELEKVFRRIKVNALVLGGVGLQKTQIAAVEKVAKKFKVNIIVPYQNYNSEELLDEEIKSEFDVRITNVAVDGLTEEWIGRRLDVKTVEEMKRLSKKYGFDTLGEGGHYDTFVVDGPIFSKRIEFVNSQKVWDSKTNSGYLDVKEATLVAK